MKALDPALRALLISIVDQQPGCTNADIRRRLMTQGGPAFDKHDLNVILYSMSADISWRELKTGGRGWHTVGLAQPSGSAKPGGSPRPEVSGNSGGFTKTDRSDEEPLILDARGPWGKGARLRR